MKKNLNIEEGQLINSISKYQTPTKDKKIEIPTAADQPTIEKKPTNDPKPATEIKPPPSQPSHTQPPEIDISAYIRTLGQLKDLLEQRTYLIEL